MPTRFAMREETLAYNDKVQEEILNFMGTTIKHDYLEGSREVNLGLKVQEAEHLYSANDSIRALAESGELQAMHNRCHDLGKSVEAGYIKVMDQLDKTLQQIADAEQDIYDDLIESDLEGLSRINSGEQNSPFFDAISLASGQAPMENYEIVRKAAAAKGDSDVVAAEKSLGSMLAARAQAMDAKAAVQEAILTKLSGDNVGACEQELAEFKEAAAAFGLASGADAGAFSGQLDEIRNGDMKSLMDDIDACAAVEDERSSVYADYYAADNVETGDAFRQNLLKHLAGSIVIKEHKLRYQKEQFDRFVTSLNFHTLKDTSLTLDEFSREYSRMIRATTDSSHNYRCPKIEANYDDFGQNTIRPLNATIFFYFFSANRSGKTWAQWMLSSARYPNDRMRRAYMRFFA